MSLTKTGANNVMRMNQDWLLALRRRFTRPRIPINCAGVSSPSSRPQGFISGIRSKMIFSTPINGIDRNIPDSPHTAAPSKTATIEISALIRTFADTI